jgi:hypothetical protein
VKAGWSLIDQYVDSAEQDLLRGFRAFEVDSDIETREITKKVIADLGRVVDGFPLDLRNSVTPERWNSEIEFAEWELSSHIPGLVTVRRLKLIEDFEHNCTTAYKALKEEVYIRINMWTAWSPAIEVECLRRFSDAVHYNEFPPAMQQAVGARYQCWLEDATMHLRDEMELKRFLAPSAIVFAVIVTAVVIPMRRRLLTNQYRVREAA